MIEISFQTVEIKKRFPLAISRGTMAGSRNLFVRVRCGAHEGIGELSPATASDWTADRGERQLRAFIESTPSLLESVPAPMDTFAAMQHANIDPPAMAAFDIALWDLTAKQAGMPLYRLLGLPKRAVPTSVTIGLNPPEITRERVPQILEDTGARSLKIKLGSPSGLEFDRAHFMAALESSSSYGVRLRIDANGGWTADQAIEMIGWLAERGVDYVEQPLAAGQESELPSVFKHRRLPIFLDESIRTSADVPGVADRCDGVNLKLMKTGGITEAVRLVATARAHRLGTMIGCMSETGVAIAAGASLSALFDHIDLDSHLNLDADPTDGLTIEGGVILPPDTCGHGVSLRA